MMLKKVWMALLAAVLLAAPAAAQAAPAATAFAQTDGPPAGDRHRGQSFGQIVEIGTGSLTLENRRGTLVVAITDETAFFSPDGTEIGLEDFEVGRWVIGRGERDAEGTVAARVIVLLPEEFDPSEEGLHRIGGEVEQVNPGQETFRLGVRNGESLTIQVDGDTAYMGQVAGFDDLEKGMRLAVVVSRQEGGTLLARLVAAAPRRDDNLRAAGRVTQIAGINVTIETRGGEELTVQVSGETRFMGQQVMSLDELEEGMGILIQYQEQENGQLDAVVIAAGRTPGEKALGRVQGVSDESLTLVTRAGQELTVTVTDETRLMGFDELGDLETGQWVGLVYESLSDGSLLAKVIAVRVPRGPERP